MGTKTSDGLYLGHIIIMKRYDLSKDDLRTVNRSLQKREGIGDSKFQIINPRGSHALACGLMHPVNVKIIGHVGYYCAGMNQEATILVEGNSGPGVAENMMSGKVHIKGDASQYAGATAHGGILIVDGHASSRCGISMKGIDIVVKGSIGHLGAFMAQAGNLVVCGDAGPDLGDSLYEAQIFIGGSVESLGIDCQESEMTAERSAALVCLLEKAEIKSNPSTFKCYGSARSLYHFNIDNAGYY